MRVDETMITMKRSEFTQIVFMLKKKLLFAAIYKQINGKKANHFNTEYKNS